MSQDEDWLALQVAASQSPFQRFQRPDSPFEAPDPGADSVYSTQDVNRIQERRGRGNPLKSAFGWLKGILPHGEEKAPRQSLPEALANPKSVGFGERVADLPARALNMAAGIPETLLHSGEHYAGWQGHGMGEFDPLAVAVPPQAMAAFVPGLRGRIAAGEANPISTYDKVRARLEDTPILNWSRNSGVTGDRPGIPLPGSPAESAIWPGADFLPESGPAWKHQQNPFSDEAGRIRGHLQSLGKETWPKAPAFEDTTPVGPTGNMRRLPGEPPNDRNIGTVAPSGMTLEEAVKIVGAEPYWAPPGEGPTIRAESGDKAAPFVGPDRSPREARLAEAKREFHQLDPEAGSNRWERQEAALPDDRARMNRYDIGQRDFRWGDRPFKLNAESGERAAPFARRTEPLPLTQGVADWVREATGQEPGLRIARGKNETDYVGLPHPQQLRDAGLPRTKVRVPDDGHPGWPEPGLIDTGQTKPGRMDNDTYSRVNAAGEPFSNYQALIDALKWATSSAPGGGNWLVSPGKEPRWARYAKEEPAAAPKEQASPDQLKLLSKGGDLRTALISAYPDKAAAITKTLDSLKGVSPYGIANVLEQQHGIPKTQTLGAIKAPAGGMVGGRPPVFGAYLEEQLGKVSQMLKRSGESYRNPWTPDDIAKTRLIIGEQQTSSPAKVWQTFRERHPERAQELSKARVDERAMRRMMLQKGEELGVDTSKRLGSGEARPWQGKNARIHDPVFVKQFWDAWDKHAGHQQRVADELNIPQSTVNRYKAVIKRPEGSQPPDAAAAEAQRQAQLKQQRQERWADIRRSGPVTPTHGPTGKPLGSVAKAQREQRSQDKRSQPELEERGGKPFWDETGRAEATQRDREAVERLFGHRVRED